MSRNATRRRASVAGITMAVLSACAFLGVGVRAVAAQSAPPVVSPATPAAVPTGIRVPVTLGETLSSGVVRVGQTFTFRTDRAQTLGPLAVPGATLGTGRVASVTRAVKGHSGSMQLQADELYVPGDSTPVWVDMSGKALDAHYAKKHVFPAVVPVPPFFIPTAYVSHTGDLIIDAGTHFSVVTSVARPGLSPLAGGATPDPSLTPFVVPQPIRQ